MAKLEGISVYNYQALRSVTLGRRLRYGPQDDPLTPMTAIIGKNGVGKSSLFDAFGFLADCLRLGVEEACDARGRGGFDRIHSQEISEPFPSLTGNGISFGIIYREEPGAQSITYMIRIERDGTGRPFVAVESLGQERRGHVGGEPLWFLCLVRGKGIVYKGASEGLRDELGSGLEPDEILAAMKSKFQDDPNVEFVDIKDKRRLGIATLGGLGQHPRIAAFREFIEGWYLSYFTPDAARGMPLAGIQKHLNIHGDNLGNVVQFMEREHRDRFDIILRLIAEKIPGIDKIDTERSPGGRLLLRFNDKGFDDPFYAQQMSDGTLKLFAYLLMLEDPAPPPFICIEEPENGLYPKLLETLATEFRAHTTGRQNASQIFVTTYQPYFINALKPEEVCMLGKMDDGFSKIRRASDYSIVRAMVDEGLPLGGLWYSDYLD